jgi:hypothetical protein
MGARGLSRYEAIQTSPIGGGEIWRVILEVRIAYRLDRASKLTAAVRTIYLSGGYLRMLQGVS